MMAAIPAAMAVVLVGAWAMLPTRQAAGPGPPVAATPAPPAPKTDPAPKPAEPVRLDRRWLPDQTRMLLGLRLSRWQHQEGFSRAIDFMETAWQGSVERVLAAFGLKFHAVARLSWAATDLRKWTDECVVVLELDEQQNAESFRVLGQPVGLRLQGIECRRLPAGDWPHPFAVLDARTIVSGPEPLLRHLATRVEIKLESEAMNRLLEAPVSDADAALLVDLATARDAGWKLPESALDVWPAGRVAWRSVWQMPRAVGLTCQTADRNMLEVGFACDGETSAQQIHAVVDELIPAAASGLAAQAESVDQSVRAGQITADTAAAYQRLLKQAQADLKEARWEVAGDTIWLRVHSTPGLSELVAAAWDSRKAVRSAWLRGARGADEAHHRKILEGLEVYRSDAGSFPPAVGGGSLLAPETRLSWIASMLPYFGHRDWHQQLEFGYSWNGNQNKPVAGRALEEVINPALGASDADSGFPVTHYVGLAGIGAQAAELPAGDRRAGVFGYGRKTRLRDIPDGASNTIATVGVAEKLGPWAAGGNATVRAFTERPYVNGPDGFGSGQPDGMLVGMADGAVRFVSRDVDPLVLEQLATAGGGEKVLVAALDPKPALLPAAPAPAPSRPGGETGVSGPAAVAEAAPGEPPPQAAESAMASTATVVDVDARLADRIPRMEFADTPLIAAVDLLSQISTVPVTYDLEALEMLGVGLFDRVTARVVDATMGEVFAAVLSSKALTFVAENGQLLVTCPSKMRTELRTVPYTISDLIGPGQSSAARLEVLVRQLVAPESWQTVGGNGSIVVAGDVLTVTQTDLVQFGVLKFCEQLRVARGLPLRSRHDPGRFSLTTPMAKARGRLGRVVSLNFRDPAPLVRIVADLEQLTGASILVNWVALAEEGLSPQLEGHVQVQQQPFSEALVQLLQPLGLAYRVVDADILEITSRTATISRLELDFYPVRELTSSEAAVKDLLNRLQDEVGGGTWSDAGGPGMVQFDAPSGCLLVLQSQHVQREVEQFLSARLAGSGAGN